MRNVPAQQRKQAGYCMCDMPCVLGSRSDFLLLHGKPDSAHPLQLNEPQQ